VVESIKGQKAKAEKITSEADKDWWQQGLVVFTQISGWIIGPIIIALFLGKWLDSRYQTNPRYLLICVAVAFVISNVGLVREAIRYSRKMKKIGENKKDE